MGHTLIGLSVHGNRLVRQTARKLLIDWVNNVGPISAIADQKGFENLVENCAEEISQNNRKADVNFKNSVNKIIM